MRTLIILLLISFNLVSQNKYPRLLTSSNGITYTNKDTIRVKDIKFQKKSDSILIITPAGTKIKIHENNIWGLKGDHDMFATRIYKKHYLKVVEEGIVLYEDMSSRQQTILYFSKLVNDEPIEFNLTNIENTYSNNICFVSKIRQIFKKYKKGSMYFSGNIRKEYAECMNWK